MGYIFKCLKRLNISGKYGKNIQALQMSLNLILEKKQEIIEMESISVLNSPTFWAIMYETFSVFNAALIIDINKYQLKKKYELDIFQTLSHCKKGIWPLGPSSMSQAPIHSNTQFLGDLLQAKYQKPTFNTKKVTVWTRVCHRNTTEIWPWGQCAYRLLSMVVHATYSFVDLPRCQISQIHIQNPNLSPKKQEFNLGVKVRRSKATI